MAEERISERIDANMMDVTIDEVAETPRDVFAKRIGRFTSKTTGKLVVKEYPTGSAHVGHFRHLLNELKMKIKEANNTCTYYRKIPTGKKVVEMKYDLYSTSFRLFSCQ
mgnify:CR=1 FL=1